jgi:hypothetical protein
MCRYRTIRRDTCEKIGAAYNKAAKDRTHIDGMISVLEGIGMGILGTKLSIFYCFKAWGWEKSILFPGFDQEMPSEPNAN